jgi:hypothetical protein
LYAELCRRFAHDPVAARILTRYGEGRGALALLGGLHYLVLAGDASWDDPLRQHEEFLAEWVATQNVQTNEVQRCWVLLPLFLHTVREPVHVVELGCSAGLNLAFDRYGYEYDTWSHGGALVLRGEERRALPASLFERELVVCSRVGIDRAPIDVTSDDGVRLLESFIWPGQDQRVARLHGAVDIVRDDPPQIVAGDAAEVLPAVLDALDGPTLVFHTSAFEYMPPESRARVRDVLRERNVTFVTSGAPRDDSRAWGMRVFRPGGGREYVGEADYHGAWLRYDL